MMIKTPLRSAFCGLLLSAAASHAAAVFYSFDTDYDGNRDFTPEVTENDGFAFASAISGNFQSTGSAPGEGGATFDDFTGQTWSGSGGRNTPGHSLLWNPNSSENSFSFTLDTTGLTDLQIRMDVRSAGPARPTEFASFTYDIGAGEVEVEDNILNFTGSSFSEWSVDLSSIAFVNNASSVTFTWYIPDVGGDTSFRVDNIQVGAIPEPSTSALIFAGLSFGIVLCRRRKRN